MEPETDRELLTPARDRRADLIRLGIVIVLAVSLRTWMIRHTEVAARDSIGYIRYALQLDEKPWSQVIKSSEQHPGYPVAIWAMSQPVRMIGGGVSCDSMVLSAQLASLLASVLTIFPIYFVGKRLFERDAGFVAAALWQCLPVCLHITSDGLSEATFLMFVSWSLFFCIAGLTKPTVWRFFACGLGSGLAYLTRPEGGEVAVAAGLVVSILGLGAWGWKRTGLRLGGLASGAAPSLALYVGLTGHFTNKPTPNEVIKGGSHEVAPEVGQARVGSPVLLAAFWDPQINAGQSRTLWSMKTLVLETAKAGHYFPLLFAGLAGWWLRGRIRRDPGLCLLIALAGMHTLLLIRLTVVIGYLSERHTVLLALLGVIWAGAAIAMLGRKMEQYIPRLSRWTPALAALLLLAWGMLPALKPLHANRAGHHAAGLWLAQYASPRDEIIDPVAFAHYYAGAVFREGRDDMPLPHLRTRYVVLEQTGNVHSRLTGMQIARDFAQQGEPVYHWPEGRKRENASVVVYRVGPK